MTALFFLVGMVKQKQRFLKKTHVKKAHVSGNGLSARVRQTESV